MENRFPDFLKEDERAALQPELDFWASHFKGQQYQDESDDSYRDWIEHIGSTPDCDVVELGCGSGALLKRLPARLRMGLEPAVNLLEPSNGFSGIIGTSHDLPFRDESFDVVLFKHALHHVQDKRRGFEEAERILRPGGKLVIIEPNAEHPQRRLISNPRSWLRTSGVFTRFIGPVETFQPISELVEWGMDLGLEVDHHFYGESSYDRLTVRQALQKVYARSLSPFLPERYLLPNYFIRFRKPVFQS